MDLFFKALADPTRRAILKLLKEGDKSVSELLEHFPISQPSLSHHLDALKRADLVVTRREGQFIIYSLNVSVFEETMTNLYEHFHITTNDDN